jgi:hypothetical protein
VRRDVTKSRTMMKLEAKIVDMIIMDNFDFIKNYLGPTLGD